MPSDRQKQPKYRRRYEEKRWGDDKEGLRAYNRDRMREYRKTKNEFEDRDRDFEQREGRAPKSASR
jgi:hypothetical protein